MNANASSLQLISSSPRRSSCWVEALALGLALPAAIWAFSKIVAVVFPSAVSGTPEQRFLLWLLGGVAAEWLFVAALWLTLVSRGSSFRDLGVWRFGTWAGWTVALAAAALSIGSNLRFLPRMHIPIMNAFLPTGFHLAGALMMGITAGFCEEVLFRAFLMSEFAAAGYGKVMQVLIPGLAFGLSHAGFLNQGFLVWLGIMLPTAFLGMIWGIAYLLGRRSLVPAMVAHFLNDSTALPWVMFFMIAGRQ
jgi:membrane protease YdiL (CAAX protease family)